MGGGRRRSLKRAEHVCWELSKEAVERPHQAPAKQVGRQAVSDAADAGLGCTAAAAAAAVVRDRIGNVAAHP